MIGRMFVEVGVAHMSLAAGTLLVSRITLFDDLNIVKSKDIQIRLRLRAKGTFSPYGQNTY